MGKGIVKLGEGNWAVKDGNLLAAKETNGRFKNAEFTVTRGSDATYVNRDGLIKQTSSNIESEVFLNPNFDDTITLGNAGSGWSDSGLGEVTFYNGGLKITGEGVDTAKARARDASLSSAILETSRLYELTYTIKSISSKNNTLSLYMAGNTHTITQKSVGTHTILVASGTNANKIFQFQWSQSDNESIVLGSVSLKESLVANGTFDTDTDSDWTLVGGATIENDALHFESNTNEYSYARQDISSLAANTYKIQLEIKNYVSGACQVGFTGTSPIFKNLNVTADGTYTAYISPNVNGNDLEISREFGGGNFNFDVDNVSVFEIDNAALPRIDFTNNTDGHLLLEPQSTNLIPYSEDFSSPNWAHKVSASVDPNVVVSPDGTQNASRLNFHQGSTTSRIEKQIVGQTTGSYTFSVWAKSTTNDDVEFEMEIGSAGTGTISKTATSEWQRFQITGSISSGTVNLYPQIESYTSTNPSIYIWGAQLEKLPYPTSYMPTSGSTVTRDAETCTSAGEAADFNSEEGVLYAEIATLSEDNNEVTKSISLSFNTTNRVMILTNAESKTQVNIRRSDNSLNKFAAVLNPSESVSFNKIAILYKSGENKIFVNGTRITNTDFDSFTFDFVGNSKSFKKLDFANGGAGGNFQGKCKAIRVYKEALSPAELENLTSL